MAATHEHRYAARARRYQQTAPVRRAYLAGLPGTAPSGPRLALSVVSFSAQRHLAEQAVSVRSFLRHVGVPAAWTIVSDGSHSRAGRRLLEHLHDCVRVVALGDVLRADLPAAVAAYAAEHPFGKKLAVEVSLRVPGPTLYADADVVFFPVAGELPSLAGGDPRPRYLRDCGRYVDERLVPDGAPPEPANGGLFLLREPLDWAEALARLRALRGRPGFFTEQTLLQVAMRSSAGVELDPSRYVVSRADEHVETDFFAGPRIALRHYTTPVRHKLWAAVERFGL
jgi:hypothetical protein